MVENDRATQAVSHQSPGRPWAKIARPAYDQAQVRVVVVETVDMPAAPFRTAVAAAVELSHRDAARKQSPSHVAIEPTMGAKAMNGDQDQPRRACGSEVLDMQRQTARDEGLFLGGLTCDVHPHGIP